MTEADARVELEEGLKAAAGASRTEITLEEFMSYYMTVSATMPFDEVFVQMIQSVWHVEEKDRDRMSPELGDCLAILKNKLAEKTQGYVGGSFHLRGLIKCIDKMSQSTRCFEP